MLIKCKHDILISINLQSEETIIVYRSQLNIETIWITTVFSPPFFSIPSPWTAFYLIYLLLDHLHPPHVGHPNPHLSTCPIRHPLWFLMCCGSLGSTVQKSSPHKCDQKSSYSAFNAVVASFPLDIFRFPSFLYVHEACLYYWSFLEDFTNRWSTYYELHSSYLRRNSSSNNLSLVSYLWDFNWERLITTCSNLSTSSDKAQGLIYYFGSLSLH